MAKRKCRVCGNWIENNAESVPYKGGYAHSECFNIAMRVTVTQKKETLASTSTKKSSPSKVKPLKEGLSEEEFQEKKKLCEYIKELTKEDLSVATYKLIEDYKKKYKISYAEMQQDLFWYFELCDHEVEGEMVIGIVPTAHTSAQKYYKEVERSKAMCQEMIPKLSEMYKETTAIASVRPEKKVPLIDIATIGSEG